MSMSRKNNKRKKKAVFAQSIDLSHCYKFEFMEAIDKENKGTIEMGKQNSDDVRMPFVVAPDNLSDCLQS